MEVVYFTLGERNYIRSVRMFEILRGYVTFRADECEIAECIITYGRLAERMGYGSQAGVGFAQPLGLIGRYCQHNDLPAINMMVVNSNSFEPGHIMLSQGRKTLNAEQDAVKNFDWYSIRPPKSTDFKKFLADIQ